LTRTLLRVVALAAIGAFGAPLAAQEEAVDRALLMEDLFVLAHDSMQGRLVGSDGGAAARRHLVRRLTAIGLEVEEQRFTAPDGVEGVNLLATLPGTDGARAELVLTAHYDHVGVRGGEIYNGADDNASGTAAVLAIARVLRRAPLRSTVRIALVDGEEGGLRGARAFVSRARQSGELDRFGLNVNLDMVSRSDRELWIAGTHQNPSLRPVAEGVVPVGGVALRFGHDTPEDRGSDNWVGASDHAAFHQAGVPFLYLGVEDHPDYHRPGDDAEKVDPEWYGDATDTILRLLRALDAAGVV
jgi:Zn-dependent M28 family amino/carboxypeptidase